MASTGTCASTSTTPRPAGAPDLPWWGALPGLGAKAEEQWQASGEAEAG